MKRHRAATTVYLHGASSFYDGCIMSFAAFDPDVPLRDVARRAPYPSIDSHGDIVCVDNANQRLREWAKWAHGAHSLVPEQPGIYGPELYPSFRLSQLWWLYVANAGIRRFSHADLGIHGEGLLLTVHLTAAGLSHRDQLLLMAPVLGYYRKMEEMPFGQPNKWKRS